MKDIIETFLNTDGYINEKLWAKDRNISTEEAIKELNWAEKLDMIERVLLIETKQFRFITRSSIGDIVNLTDYNYVIDEDENEELEITNYNCREVYIVDKTNVENIKNFTDYINKALKEFCKGYIFDSLKDEDNEKN